MAKTYKQILKETNATFGGKLGEKKKSFDEILKSEYDFSNIKRNLESSIGFDTFNSDLETIGKTVNDIYNGWQPQETMVNTRSTVESMMERINAFQEYQKLFGGEDAHDVSDLLNSYNTVLKDWDSLSETYSQYKTADAFNTVRKNTELEKKFSHEDGSGYTFDEVQKELKKYAPDSDEYKYLSSYTNYSDLNDFNKAMESEGFLSIQNQIAALKAEKEKLDSEYKEKGGYVPSASNYNRPAFSEIDAYKEWQTKSSELENKIKALEDSGYYGELKKKKNLHELEHKVDLYKPEYEGKDDFDENSQYVTTIDGNKKKNIFNPLGKYGDVTYEFINNNNGIRDEILTIDAALNQDANGYESEWQAKGYDLLREDEVAIYNYKYHVEGKESANKFLDDMQTVLDKRRTDKLSKNWERNAEKMPFVSNLATVISKPAGAIIGAIGDTLDLLQGKDYNPYSNAHTISNFVSDTRKYTGEDIAEKTEGFELFGQNIPSFLYNTGMSIADSAYGIASFGEFHTYLMGTSAFQDKAKEMVESGESKDVVWKSAITSGVAEALFEKIGIDNLFKIKSVDSLSSAVKSALKQAGAEASEEIGTEITNMIADDVIRGKDSELYKFYNDLITRGYSKSEALTKTALKAGSQVAWAGIGGALSGAVMGGVTSAGNYVSNKSTGAEIRENERVGDMLNIASMTPQESDTYKAYTEYANRGINAENITDAQLGNLRSIAETDAQETLASKDGLFKKGATVEQKKSAVKTLHELQKVDTENVAAKKAKELTKDLKTGENTEITETGKSTTIKGIKKDTNEVITSDGETVSENDVTFSERDIELLGYAKQMDETTANLLLEIDDGKADVTHYVDSFNLAIEYAKRDFTQDTILENRGVLSTSQVNAIYSDTIINTYKVKQAAIDNLNSKYGKTFTIQGKVDDSIIDYDNTGAEGKVVWNSLNTSQRKAITFMKGLAKATGMNLRLISNGMEEGINGAFKISENTIILDIYAGMDKVEGTDFSDSIIPTASHEMTHWMKEKAPQLYRAVDELIFKTLKQSGLTESQILDQRRLRMEENHPNHTFSEEEVRDEVIARSCEDMLSMSEEGKKLFNSLNAAEQKTFIEKIQEIIQNLKDWVTDLLSHYKSTTPEAREMRKYQDSLEELSKLWDEMLRQSIQANQSLQKEGITGEELAKSVSEDVKYSRRKVEKNKKNYYNKNSYYDEFKSYAMQWANSFGTKQGDYNSFYDSKSNKWCLAVADKNSDVGYRIVTIGNYEEVKELEQIYNEENESFDRYVETYDSVKRTSDSDLWESPNREMFGRNSQVSNPEQEGTQGNPSTENAEYVRSDNRETSAETKYSDRDNLGNALTEEQQSYFAESKARDENGNLKIVYHGTRNADFTVFKRNVTYFTDNKSMADSYSPNGEMFEGYVNITKPYEIDAKGEKWSMLPIDEATVNLLKEYGASVFKEKGKWRTTPADIASAIEEAVDNGELDYDGIIIKNIDDTGSYYKGKETHLANDYIVFNSNQFKNASNKNPTENKDIRFSMRENVEETKELVAVHNLSEEKLIKSLKLGGLPMPSIAIIKARDGHNTFGSISLVFSKDTIDPQFIRKNKVYSGDAWTPTYPRVEYKVSYKAAEKIRNKIDELLEGTDYKEAFGYLALDTDSIQDYFNRNNGDVYDAYGRKEAFKIAFLKDKGIDLELPSKEKQLSYRFDNAVIVEFANKYDKDKLYEMRNYDNISMVDQHIPEIKEIVERYYSEQVGTDMEWQINRNDVWEFFDGAWKYLKNGITKETDTYASRDIINSAIDENEYKSWLNNLFSDIIEKEGIRNNKDLFTPSGNRRSFEALHYEHNLENVIKAMKESGEKGVGAFGGGNIFGAATTEYNSISEIKEAAQTRLKNMPHEEYEAIRKGFSDRLFELAYSLPIHKDSFTATDSAANMLIEAVIKFKTKSGMANYLRKESEGWANYSDYIVDDLIQLISEIRQMPIGYFEAKPQRAVEFNEIATAIIPDSTSAELKTMLTDTGVKFVEYESGNDEARLEALNSLEDVKFSDRDSAYMDAVNNGDMETAQKLVDEAAKNNGYTIHSYHGTRDKSFTEFKKEFIGSRFSFDDKGFFFIDRKSIADDYAHSDFDAKAYGRILDVYLKIEKPLIVDESFCLKEGLGNPFRDDDAIGVWDAYSEFFKEEAETRKVDGIILDDGMSKMTVVFDPEQIKSADPVTYDNNGNVIPLSERFNIANKDIRYSDRDDVSVYETTGELERLRKENEKFKADIERLKERLDLERKVTGGNTFNRNQLDAVAGHIRKLANSDYAKAELVKQLNDVYTYIATSKELTWEDVFSKVYDISKTILKESRPYKVEENDYFKEILKEIRTQKISLSDVQKQELESAYGTSWNRAVFGKLNVSNDATMSLDSQWSVWANVHPDLFDAETTEGDQIIRLLEIYDDVKDGSETFDTLNNEDMTRWLANEIYNQYWNVSAIKTTADKYDKKIKLLNFDHRKAMKELRDNYEERLAKQKKADKSKYNEIIKNIRQRKEQEIQEVRKLGKERMDKYKENAERKTRIQSITSQALTLNEWLIKNSKDKHIHESLKGPVTNLLQAIDFSSKQLLGMRGGENKGTPTRNDISLAKALSKVQKMMADANVGKEELVELYGHDLDANIEKMMESVDNIMSAVGDNEFVLNKMTLNDLITLDNIVKTVKHAVTKMNKFHVVHHAQGISNLAQETIVDVDKLGGAKIFNPEKLKGKAQKLLNWRNIVPYYAFKRFGNSGKKIFEAFQDGWDKLAFNVKEIIDFTNETYDAKDVREWEEELHTFNLRIPATEEEMASPVYEPQYQKVQMTTAQIMHLYLLNMRPAAKTHLFGGGIRVADIKTKKGKVISQTEGIIFEQSEIDTIIKTLTPEQKEVANALSKFMNTTSSDWGNEVSMARFGYKAFTEENYVPIQADKNNLAVDDETEKGNSLFKLLNMSFTKSLVDNANNRIVISSLFDVFAQHTSDMAKYNALALPVLDAFRWFNYKEKGYKGEQAFITKSVKTSIEKAFGKDGQSYITTFLKDINGQENVTRDTIGSGFFKNAKIASVGMNIRVALLQPTAYLKASANIDNKYLVRALFHKPKIAKAEKYCGIALWKSMGYFDTNVQRGVADQIKHAETKTDKMVEWSMKGAELGDKLTFGYLWNASELEVREKRKDLKVGSEEFFNEVGKRLRDIIYSTQVVDSTLTRSEMMRSSDGRDKMLTAFASEPTLAYNMVQDAYMEMSLEARRLKQAGEKHSKKKAFAKHGKRMARVVTAYTITNIVAALVESGFDVLRDDEEEEMNLAEFMKLYLENFADNQMISTKIPYLKEFVSIMQGFTSTRTDTQWMASFSNTLKQVIKLVEGDGNPVKLIKNSLQTFSYFSGLPFYNAYRDFMATLDKTEILTTEDFEELLNEFID